MCVGPVKVNRWFRLIHVISSALSSLAMDTGALYRKMLF